MSQRQIPMLGFGAVLGVLLLAGVGMVLVVADGGAEGQRIAEDGAVNAAWELDLPDELRAQLYQFAIRPGSSEVLATSPDAVLAVDGQGEVKVVLELAKGDHGESATLAPDASRIGVLTHDHHALAGFRLLTDDGEELAAVESTTQFAYRIAPGGDTFVGIDADGEHVPPKATTWTYTFYDDRGEELAVVESRDPGATDAVFTDDGEGFVVNGSDGVRIYEAASGRELWRIDRPGRRLATSTLESGVTLVSDPDERNTVEAYRQAELLWSVALEGPVRNVAVSPNGEFLLATDRSTATLFTPGDGSALFEFSVPEEGFALNDATVNDRGVVALGAQNPDLKGGVVYILDADGGLIGERPVLYELSSAFVPGVQFDASGGTLLAWTLEQVFLFGGE